MFANSGKAIEAYERKRVNADSLFDRYVAALKNRDLAGRRAYPAPAKRGLKLFVGTAQCELRHSGATFSKEEFHDNGLPVLAGSASDTGRAAGIPSVLASIFNGIGPFGDNPTGETTDRLTYLPPPLSQLDAFKTPGLRNVALTAPYMHDGRFESLEAVLEFYAKGEENGRAQALVGKREGTLDLIPQPTHAQMADLVAFLKILSGAAVPPELTRPLNAPLCARLPGRTRTIQFDAKK